MRPFPRDRVARRLAAASVYPLVVICAPVGSGKSTALDDYLETLEGQFLRFDFSARGASIASVLVDVERVLDHAYEGTIALDGLEVAQRDPAIAGYVVELIERSKERVRWILVTRSSVELPIGTWVAFGDCAPVIGPDDLAFTVGEALEAAQWLGGSIEREELEGFVRATNGFAAAVIVALRAASAGLDRHRTREEVRDVSHRLWAEQVYADASEDERSLLSVAAVLPEIDVALLERAGFGDALRTIESFRQRNSMLDDAGDGRYRCSDLFKEFLRRQTELLGRGERQGAYARAAAALEGAGKVEFALDAYVAAESTADVLRLLTSSGFELLERGRSDVTARAIETLSDTDKQSNPRILALRGALQAVAGNAVRAEALLRRSLARASDDRELAGFARLRLARLIANYGSDIVDVLNPVAEDKSQPEVVRAEALSLRATAHAIIGNAEAAEVDISDVDTLLAAVDADSSRAKILQRVGVAAMYIKDNDRARQSLVQAAELANELHLHSIASRSWSALSNLMCHEYDDVMSQLWYAERAATSARVSGDTLDLQTALLQVAAAEMRRGNAEESQAIEDQLQGIRSDPNRAFLLSAFRALRLGWGGRFGEAHRELASCWNKMYYDFDRIVCGAQCTLFLALDGRPGPSSQLVGEVVRLASSVKARGLFCERYVTLALLLCAFAEAVNGRAIYAGRIVAQMSDDESDSVVAIARRMAEWFTKGVKTPIRPGELNPALDGLTKNGYADVARLIRAAYDATAAKAPAAADLTAAELAVLRLLGEGFSTKEIALRSGRSVNTVRVHVANVISKLACHGRSQAVAVARRLGIIP